MPLFARLRDHHYPDAERSSRLDYYIVLSGGLQVGGFHRIGSGPSEGRWSWGAWIGGGIATFTASGCSHAPTCASSRTRSRDRRAARQTRAPRLRGHRRPMIATRTGGSDQCYAWNGASPSDPAN